MTDQSQSKVAYSDRFQSGDAVAAYEEAEYGASSYSTFIWGLQKQLLPSILQDVRRANSGSLRLLDFACGTGRIVSCVEREADECDGLDISAAMVELAKAKCQKARLQVGDLIAQPDLLTPFYDAITCFRFLLNVEPEVRLQALKRLRALIKEPSGRLIINVHGNSRSLRHPAIAWKRWRQKNAPRLEQGAPQMLNEMSPGETLQLFRDAGFKVERQLGFGVVPPTLYRTPLRGLVQWFDAATAGKKWCSTTAVDILFICAPAG